MCKFLGILLLLSLVKTGGSQTFLNGSFETNTAATCDFNLGNAAWTSKVTNCFGFGGGNELDIFQSSCSYGMAQNGNWMAALAAPSGNTDAFTMTLSAPLVMGTSYTIQFYDKGDLTYTPGTPIKIGLSTVSGALGTNLFTGPVPTAGVWNARVFTFIAPNNGQYISVSTTGATRWTHVDNFSFVGCSAPILSVTPSSAICLGSSKTLTVSGASSYTWSPVSSLSTSSGSNVVASPTTNTSYTVLAGSGTCTSSAVVTVSVATIPTLAVSPSATTICSGKSATLSATGASTYSWNPTGSLSAASGSLVIATPTINTNYTLTGANGSCTNTAVVQVSVVSAPLVSISSATAICSGSSLPLNGSGATSYTWSPGNGLSSTSLATVTASPTITTTYSLVGSDGVCTNTATQTINVFTIPNLTVTPSSIGICAGTTVSLNASGAGSYSWSPSGSLNTTTGSVVVASPATSTNYTIVGANGICTNSTVASVNVVSAPVVTVSPQTATLCSGSSTVLNAGGASSYTWTPTAGLSSSGGNSVTASPNTSTIYKVTGGVGTCTAIAEATITIISTPTINVNSAAICSGNTVSLNATGALSYTWSPTTALSNANGNSVTANPMSSIAYNVMGENNGCFSSAVSNISVTTTPTVSATSGSICSGSFINLSATGATSYSWSPSNGLNTTTSSFVIANPNVTTSYTVIGANGMCTSSVVTTLSVTSTPTLSVISGSICQGSSLPVMANGASSYTWSPSATLSSSTGSVVNADPATTTSYTVIGVNGACTNTTIATVVVHPYVVIATSTDAQMCSGERETLYATGGGSYSWAPSTGIITYKDSIIKVSPQATTVYSVTIDKIGYCSKTATIAVIVHPLPVIDAGMDTTVNIDQAVTLNGTGDVYVGFLNSLNPDLTCNFCSSITVNPQETTCYILMGENSFGCRSFDTVCVNVTKEWEVFIPNSFTPNGDMLNDVFSPSGYGLKEIKMWIYNRWGELIFQSNDANLGWDGTYKGAPCQQGVYVYRVDAVSMGGKQFQKIGHVSLISKLK